MRVEEWWKWRMKLQRMGTTYVLTREFGGFFVSLRGCSAVSVGKYNFAFFLQCCVCCNKAAERFRKAAFANGLQKM